MPLQAFMIGGHPSRLMKAMELHNKNVPKRYKEPLIPEPRDAIEREERLATVWMTFVLDAGFAMNSFWSQSMDLAEVRCNLPTSAEEIPQEGESGFHIWRMSAHKDRTS